MANVPVKDATGATGYLKAAGAGSDGDPYISQNSTTLLAGTAGIGKLIANSGVDIGDVDVTSVVPGTGATNLGKAEDAAHTGGDVGVMALTVRQDTAAALSGTDADYQPLITDANGRLHVIDVATTAIKTAVEIMDDWDDTDRAKVAQPGTVVTVAPTTDTAQYATGELIGGKLTLANAVRVSGGSGTIQSIVVIDQANQKSAVDILFFEADPSGTTFTDQAAFDVADADLLNAAGLISIAANDYVSLADNAIATKSNINLKFKLDTGTSLYAAFISRGTPTYVAGTDVLIKVGIEQN